MHHLDFDFTDKNVSPWGGLRFIQEFYNRCGLKEQIEKLPLPPAGSNRGYNPVHIIEGFLVSVILGAKRFAHSGMLRYDEVIKQIFGWDKGMASQPTFTRFFRKFSLEDNDEHFAQLNAWWFHNLNIDKHTLDIDSSVITRYGRQEGVEIGYNPKRPGRGSHHPIIAFSAETNMVVQAWMRYGDSVSSTDLQDFFGEVLRALPKERIGLIRCDSGFYSKKILDYFEHLVLQYIVCAKMNQGLVQRIFEQRNWLAAQDGIEYCSFSYKAKGWSEERRFIVVRKDSEKLPKSAGKSLFPEYDEFYKYRYSAFVTNVPFSGDLIWHLYKHRAEAENQIKELKESYGMEGFCSESFEATESAFRWVMVAFNLMSLFKRIMLKTKHIPTLTTLKFQCIAIGSYLVKRSRKSILKLAVKDKRRSFLEALFIRLDQVSPLTIKKMIKV